MQSKTALLDWEYAPTLERDLARGRVLERLGRLPEAATAYRDGVDPDWPEDPFRGQSVQKSSP